MESFSSALFYGLFVSQIIVVSWWLPNRVLARMAHVRATYPQAEYPKLYPRSAEMHGLYSDVFRWLTRAILVVGIVILFALLFVVDHASFADDGYISEFWPALYGMLQYLPFMFLELTEFRTYKLMRAANTATDRRAELLPRRLFDFVSPVLFSTAVAVFGITVFADLALHETDGLAAWLTVSHLFLIAVGAWILRGRNLNPHQSIADRRRQIAASLTSFAYLSIVMSAYFLFAIADDIYDLDYLDAAMMSAYFQIIALGSIAYMMHRMSLGDCDFDVYRAPETRDTVTDARA